MNDVVVRKTVLIALLALAVQFAFARAGQAQGCQDQYCVYNEFTTCYQCLNDSGFYCTGHGQKCPKSCTSGLCNPAGIVAGIPQTANSSLDIAEPSVRPVSDSCLDNLAKTAVQPVSSPAGSFATFGAYQKNSPAILVEWTNAVDDKGSSIAVKRVVMQNLTKTPITGYQIGWIQVTTDSSVKPEVHLLEPTSDRLDSKSIKEIGEPLPKDTLDDEVAQAQWDAYFSSGKTVVPPIAISPELKAIIVFVASVKRDGAPDFNENVDELVALQRARLKPAPKDAAN